MAWAKIPKSRNESTLYFEALGLLTPGPLKVTFHQLNGTEKSLE